MGEHVNQPHAIGPYRCGAAAAPQHHRHRRAHPPLDGVAEIADETRQVERSRLEHLALSERQQPIGELRRPRRAGADFDRGLLQRAFGRQPGRQPFGVADHHLQQVVEVVRDAAGEPADGFEPLRPRHRVLGVAPLAHFDRGADDGRAALVDERRGGRVHPGLGAVGPADPELRSRAPVPALLLVAALEQVGAVVGMDDVDRRAADEFRGFGARQRREGAIDVAQLVVLDDEQRRRARVRQVRAPGRTDRQGDGCCRSCPGRGAAGRLSGDPGLELLFAFELGGHRVGLASRRILAHAHAIGRRRSGRRRRGDERRIALAGQTARGWRRPRHAAARPRPARRTRCPARHRVGRRSLGRRGRRLAAAGFEDVGLGGRRRRRLGHGRRRERLARRRTRRARPRRPARALRAGPDSVSPRRLEGEAEGLAPAAGVAAASAASARASSGSGGIGALGRQHGPGPLSRNAPTNHDPAQEDHDGDHSGRHEEEHELFPVQLNLVKSFI